jgi:hypothetical protein
MEVEENKMIEMWTTLGKLKDVWPYSVFLSTHSFGAVIKDAMQQWRSNPCLPRFKRRLSPIDISTSMKSNYCAARGGGGEASLASMV